MESASVARCIGVIALGLVLVLWRPAAAQDARDPISTDRPGLGFSARSLPAGAVQVETGLPAIALDDEAGAHARTFSFPTLLRAGVARGIELRAASPIYTSSRVSAAGTASTTSGFGGLELGAKLTTALARGPALALIPSVILPLGDDAVTADRAGYTLNAVASWSLPGGTGLTGVAGGALNPGAPGDYNVAGGFVGVVSHALAARTGGYAEGGWYPTEGAPNPAYAGVGVTWLVQPMVQLDAFVDRGLTGAATDWIFGAGASARF